MIGIRGSPITRATAYLLRRPEQSVLQKLNDKMSRALYRGLSTPERIRPHLPVEEPDSPTKVREEQGSERSSRSHRVWETCFPHSIRLWIKQNCSYSFQKQHGLKLSDTSSKSGKIYETGGTLSVNSSLTSSSSGTGYGPSRFSFSSCYKKPFPFLPLFLLCVIGAFVLLSIAGSNRIQRVTFPPHNHRRAQLLAWREVLRGGFLGSGSIVSIPREVAVCPNGMEDYIPCYNVTANLEAGHTDGLEFEPHCEVTKKWRCLVPPPKQYRISLRWPKSGEGIWRGNLRINEATIEKRFLVEENWLKILTEDQQLMGEVGSYARQVAGMLDLSGVTDFTHAGIRSVLDIGCGQGNFGAHLSAHDVVTMCIAQYEEHGGQVQTSLERGLPAMVVSLATSQLPYPSSSYDLIHCANCGVEALSKDGMSLIEIDRVLRVGGYFVWVAPVHDGSANQEEEVLVNMKNLTSRLGWKMVSPNQHDFIVVWQKRSVRFYSTTKDKGPTLCEQGMYDADWAWRQPLRPCITVAPSNRQISVQEQLVWPARLQLTSLESAKQGHGQDESTDESHTWTGTISEYWSLLTPVIFSDHPRRSGDEDIVPTANLVRNVMDLNAGNGALNSALILSGKSVWVMNVIPTSASNTLPFIFDRGLIGTAHDWCESFPTYPRTYDLLHAADLLSQELKRPQSCGLANLFLEMDRILRPEGWVFLRDEAALIEDARAATNQMRWDSRVIEITGHSEQRLLVCQKTFWRA